jgi:hypothetical protein
LPVTANADAVYDVADYAATGTHYVRELANANPSGSSSPWYVYELKMYTNVKPAAIDIRSILPADSISLGRVLTGTSTIKEIRTDYQDGRREGAVGGNRKKFLGWKYFSGATQLSWSNPFGTRKVEPCYTWAQDANGTNESPVMSGFNSGTSPVHEYGIRNYGSNVTPFVAYTGADGVACVNTFQTSGYIGCYAKCLEEDE